MHITEWNDESVVAVKKSMGGELLHIVWNLKKIDIRNSNFNLSVAVFKTVHEKKVVQLK